MEDWRITNQQEYLSGRYFVQNAFCHEEHEHCVFCWNKLYHGDSNWFSTLDEYNWICPVCYHDFEEKFDFHLIDCMINQPMVDFLLKNLAQYDGFFPIKRLVKVLNNTKPNSLFDTNVFVALYKYCESDHSMKEITRKQYDFLDSELLMTEIQQIVDCNYDFDHGQLRLSLGYL